MPAAGGPSERGADATEVGGVWDATCRRLSEPESTSERPGDVPGVSATTGGLVFPGQNRGVGGSVGEDGALGDELVATGWKCPQAEAYHHPEQACAKTPGLL